jgi:hypothetical protein
LFVCNDKIVNLFGFFSYLSYLTHQISTKAMVFDG